MGSGFFPLPKDSDNREKLLQAIKLIEEVIEHFWEPVYSGEDRQFDNAASDGGELAMLGMAVDIIKKRIEK